MNKKITVFSILLTSITMGVFCTQPPDEVTSFRSVSVLPGDGTVSVQWWIADSTLDNMAWGFFTSVKLFRAPRDGRFELIAEFGPMVPLRAGWCLTDSSVINGTAYDYYLQTLFYLYENPEFVGFSDTFSVTPQSGLEAPRPPAPNDFSFDQPLASDTVRLSWSPPTGHDSLYYILYSHTGVDFEIFEELIDDEGNVWDPSGDGLRPVHLDSASYSFTCDRDGLFRYYQIYVFRDSVLSYPSEVLTIEHEWAP